jgi:hypothetical protein
LRAVVSLIPTPVEAVAIDGAGQDSKKGNFDRALAVNALTRV